MRLIDNSAKTNWKFLAIVVILGLTVGGRVLWYVNSLRIEPQTPQINREVILKKVNEEFILSKGQETVIEGNKIKLLNIVPPSPLCDGGILGCPTKIKLLVNNEEAYFSSHPGDKPFCCPSRIISGLQITVAEYPSENSVKLIVTKGPFVVESLSSPKTPLSVKLIIPDFTEPPKRGSEIDVTVIASVHQAYGIAKNTTVIIDLPEGITLVSGNTKWTGDVAPGNPIRLNVGMKFSKVGNWTVSARARQYVADCPNFGGFAYAYFAVSEDNVSIALQGESGECPTPVIQE